MTGAVLTLSSPTIFPTRSGAVENTGANPGCVSAWGADDMVGNVSEYVADWLPRSTGPAGSWGFSDDNQDIVGASTNGAPGAVIRGGNDNEQTLAGPFYVRADLDPDFSFNAIGFRGAR